MYRRASGGDNPDTVGKEGNVVEGDAWVEVLANKVVTVVQGNSEEFNFYFGGLGTWLGDVDEFESGELACQQPGEIIELLNADLGNERVVNLARLAADFFDCYGFHFLGGQIDAVLIESDFRR